jgi:hypothetical protein
VTDGLSRAGGRAAAADLRALMPPTMNLSVRLAGDPAFRVDT